MSSQITPQAFAAAARKLGCDVAAVRAVAEVESPKGPFLADGRPTILFEPHIFSRYTKGRFDRSHPKLSYPRWKAGAYGPGGAYQHDQRLAPAAELDREAALKACSWGQFQIMGFNHAACGYGGVQAFVNAMYRNADAQLGAFVDYVINRGLADELQRRDWAGFAYGYNGPGYAANRYDQKLAAAYARYARAAA